ncbi:MAG: putative DNA binding domain-containing protein, partial [Candidatus Latescibacteria bacterium]|nr:putative DNA binding domain-containing protein [Candidatus Latescibacterota bacterium]
MIHEAELHSILQKLKATPSERLESDVLEFKLYSSEKALHNAKDLAEEFSAFANHLGGHIIVGVRDSSDLPGCNWGDQLVGFPTIDLHITQERLSGKLRPKQQLRLAQFIFEGCSYLVISVPKPRDTLVSTTSGKVCIRDGKSSRAMEPYEIASAVKALQDYDWSAAIIDDAGIDDLDEQAIEIARANFKSKFSDKAAEVDSWDTVTFLNKAKLSIKGKITRTAIILLGKQESEHFIGPSEAKIRWLLKDSRGNDKDYLIAGCPLLLAVGKIYAKIRNSKYRYLKDGTLFPEEIDQYEPFTLREAINNCIAHQDYSLCGRINVVEMEDQLIFTNLGSFIPGDVERVVRENAPEEHYRNRFLAAAMANLKMVDTAGGGIRKMFNFQRKRFFPLPDYDLSEKRVKVTITGKVLDIDYARILARNLELSFGEIMLLDKVQKKIPLSKAEGKHLKARKLIEGRRPNFFLSKNMSQVTGQKAVYSKNKALDKAYYLDFIVKSIEVHRSLERKDVDELLWKKLPDRMDDKQKKIKINHLLSELRKLGKIKNIGTRRKSAWVVNKNPIK